METNHQEEKGTLNKKKGYSVIPNNILNDKTLSLKAKGMFAFLQGKPDGWRFSVKRMACQLKEGEKAITETLKELERAGLLERTPIKNEEGKWNGYSYVLNDNPSAEKPSADFRQTDNRQADNGITLSNKDNSNKDNSNKDISKEIQTAPPIRQDISNFLEYFKQQLGASLDNTVKSNRLYAKLLLDKLKKDFPELDPEQQAKLLVDLALADNWHSKNATTAQYIYYNKQKIIQSHTHRNVNRSRFTSI